MPRLRHLEPVERLQPWRLPPGPHNALTDVDGVAVGHFTLIEGEGAWRPGRGPFRTGVTLILPHPGNPFAEKVPAAVHAVNGFGKVYGFEQVREMGTLESPIALTSTLNVPRVADALITLALERNPEIAVGFPERGRRGYRGVNVLVGETNDGYLNDAHGRPIGEAQVRAALAAATTGPVPEGAVGAGTGTGCYGWKGGIGTASRRLPPELGGYTVGVLVQTNFGLPEELTILGIPVGRTLRPPDGGGTGMEGSVMVVLATDAPLTSRQLGRLCRRAPLGLARTGYTGHNTSGDFVVAFSTAWRVPDRSEAFLAEREALLPRSRVLNALFLAVVEATEEAVLNSLLTAETVVGRDGNVRHALPAEEVERLLARAAG